MRLVRGARINPAPVISQSGSSTDRGRSHVSGIKVNGANAIANCALLEALINPEYRKTPAKIRRIAKPVRFTLRPADG